MFELPDDPRALEAEIADTLRWFEWMDEPPTLEDRLDGALMWLTYLAGFTAIVGCLFLVLAVWG